MTGPAPLRLLVPAYAHPSTSPDLWRRLADAAAHLRLVVVNPHDGPGARLDPAYPPVVAALTRAGVRCAGYVDTAYGARSPAEVAADVAVHVNRDGLDAVFLDQVSSGLDRLDHYAQVVRLSRAAGARSVVLNPGVHPHPGYVDLANVTVTFEGTAADHRALELPDWVRRYAAGRFCHLVHGAGAGDLPLVLAAARAGGVGSVMVTDGSGPNPWDRLPPELVAALAADGTPEAAAAPLAVPAAPLAVPAAPLAVLPPPAPARPGRLARVAGRGRRPR